MKGSRPEQLSTRARAVWLVLGGLLTAGAGACLGGYLAQGGLDGFAGYLVGISVSTGVLLVGGGLPRPRRWQRARVLLGGLGLLDLMVLTPILWVTAFSRDADTGVLLVVANLLLCLAAPSAFVTGMPRPQHVGAVGAEQT